MINNYCNKYIWKCRTAFTIIIHNLVADAKSVWSWMKIVESRAEFLPCQDNDDSLVD